MDISNFFTYDGLNALFPGDALENTEEVVQRAVFYCHGAVEKESLAAILERRIAKVKDVRKACGYTCGVYY